MTLRLRPPSAVTSAALAIIVVQLVVRGVMVSRSWFLLDDHIFMADIARGQDDLDWYLRLHQGHFMPLSFLLVKLVVSVSEPYSWWPVAVEIVALQALASLACWWMLRTVFGAGRTAVVALAVYASTALTMPALLWWAVAINQYPHQIAFFGAVAAHVLYARTRRRRWVAVAGLFLLVGYLSYAKTGLIVVTLALLTLIWLVRGTPWDRFWSAVRQFRAAWLVYGALSVAWLGIYLTRPQVGLGGRPSQFLTLVQAQVFESTIPTILGGPVQWTPFGQGPVQFAAPPLPLVVTCTVVVAVALLHAWGTRRRALLVLWPVGVYLLASAVLVYEGRAFAIGLLGGGSVGIQVQYLSDAAPVLLLAGAALFRPVSDAADPPVVRDPPLTRIAPPRWALAGLVCAVVGLGLLSSTTYAQGYVDFPERRTTGQAVETLRAGDDLRLTDTLVPPSMATPLFGERSLAANYFALLREHFDVYSAGVDLRTLDEAGRLRAADVAPVEGALPEPALRRCLLVGPSGRTFDIAPPAALGLWVAVDYRSQDSGTLSVGGIGVTRLGLDAPAGRHRLLAAAPAPRQSITVSASEGTDLCVTRIRYGRVVAR